MTVGRQEARRPRKLREAASGAVGWWSAGWRLLVGVLLGLALGVALGRLLLPGDDAEGLLQEAAGLHAVGALVALGLHGGLARGRDDDFDHARHAGSSEGAKCGGGGGSVGGRPRYWRTAGCRKAGDSSASKCTKGSSKPACKR